MAMSLFSHAIGDIKPRAQIVILVCRCLTWFKPLHTELRADVKCNWNTAYNL